VDVGCGFGGTIASLNEHFSDLQLTGVNIDLRQLDRA
jgi:cyclopropane fatty-acyl-phospholipid synthase-like methyltransferase